MYNKVLNFLFLWLFISINIMLKARTEAEFIRDAKSILATQNLMGAFLTVKEGLSQFPRNSELSELKETIYTQALEKAKSDIKNKRAIGDLNEDVVLLSILMFNTSNRNWLESMEAMIGFLFDDLAARSLREEEKNELIDSLTGLTKRLFREYGEGSKFLRDKITEGIDRIKNPPMVLPAPIAPGKPLPYETRPLPPLPVPTQPTVTGAALSMDQLGSQLMQLQRQVQRLKVAMPS